MGQQGAKQVKRMMMIESHKLQYPNLLDDTFRWFQIFFARPALNCVCDACNFYLCSTFLLSRYDDDLKCVMMGFILTQKRREKVQH